MPHLETAVARRLDRQPARATSAPREHGLSHLLEHMAFKGTRRRTRARHRRGDRERPAAISTPRRASSSTAYYAHVLAEDAPLAHRHPRRYPDRQHVRHRRTGAREGRHFAGDRRGRGYARRSRLRPLQRMPLFLASRSAGQFSARPNRSRRFEPGIDRRLSRQPLQQRRDRRSPPPARSSTRAICDEAERRFSALPAGRGNGAAPRRAMSAANCV